MITNTQLEQRVYHFFDTIFSTDKTQFGFPSAASASYIVDKQSNAPRLGASTLLYYRLDSPEPLGSAGVSDYAKINRSTHIESVDTWRKVHCTVNVISKIKGAAKSAMNFFLAANQTTRHYDASYGHNQAFVMPLHKIETPFRDLTALENENWAYVERIEADLHFNYLDNIVFNTQPMILAPSSVEDTTNHVDFDIILK
jgi:hypothetical protein